MIFFISDLHLSPERPDITQAFFNFLNTTAAKAEALYILGDFFDAWVGDDDDTEVFRDVEIALKDYSNASESQRVYFMHGNRDFLIGHDFIRRTGITLLEEPSIIELNGINTLLMHGDSLCTLDTEYINFREMVRDPKWQRSILEKTLVERKAIASQLRSTSKSMNSLKAEDIMDVTPEEVTTVMQTHQSPLLIHGHTHRPARHTLNIANISDTRPAERIVLGDWGDQGWYLQADSKNQTLELHSFSI